MGARSSSSGFRHRSGDLSLEEIPGLSKPNIDRIRAALALGTRGPVFEAVDEDGDGIRIILE